MRNHYLNDEELDQLAASESPDVCSLVELVRSLAQEHLLSRMKELARKYLRPDELHETSHLLWCAVEEGPATMDEEEATDLEQLSQMSGGWWCLDAMGGPEFLSIHEWHGRYRRP